MYTVEINMKTNEILGPLVSVITPVYNAEAFIGETLDSIINQTHSNFEILCVDDLSTDKSKEIIEEYMKRDSRVKYFRLKEKGGASVARNLGLAEAKGEFIAFLDADDTWYPNKLTSQIEFMNLNSYDFTYTDYDYLLEDGKISETYIVGPKKLTYKNILKGNCIGCLTVMYRKSAIGLIQIPRIDKRNDYALWLKALSNTNAGYRLPKILSSYRYVPGSLSNQGSKLSLLKYHFQLFTIVEDFGVMKSSIYTIFNVFTYFKNNRKLVRFK